MSQDDFKPDRRTLDLLAGRHQRGAVLQRPTVVLHVRDLDPARADCIAVPHGRPVTLRFAAPDVIHGILITGTNVNTMVVPGFVAQVHTQFTRSGDLLMPCHEYCGLGHSEMWATVQVLPESAFRPDRDGRVSCAQR
jgi:Cytochrome C oxidase subunit II, periplasmic domain